MLVNHLNFRVQQNIMVWQYNQCCRGNNPNLKISANILCHIQFPVRVIQEERPQGEQKRSGRIERRERGEENRGGNSGAESVGSFIK
jgi:hypothetical protein